MERITELKSSLKSILGNIITVTNKELIPFGKFIKITLTVSWQDDFIQPGEYFKYTGFHLGGNIKSFVPKRRYSYVYFVSLSLDQ